MNRILYIGKQRSRVFFVLHLPCKWVTDKHSDIHRNNVLVTTHPTPNDPFTTEETQLVVSDFGEGRASDSEQSIGRKYYGNVEFWAPEVKRFHKYSFASDVYAV